MNNSKSSTPSKLTAETATPTHTHTHERTDPPPFHTYTQTYKVYSQFQYHAVNSVYNYINMGKCD